MKINNSGKLSFLSFALLFAVLAVSAFVSADEGNTTGTNQSVNVSINATVNETTNNTLSNVTDNVSANVTTNVTGNMSNVTSNVTSNITSNVTTNVTTNTTNTSVNVTTNTTSNTTNTSTNDSVIDDDDIEMFKLNYGMEVRLLQLEKRLISHIIMGNIIIAEINNSDIDVNTSVLKAKIEGLEEIKDEIDEELSKDPVNVSTERFVELKAEAINLTFEFKKELYSLLTPQQIQSIKKEIPKKMSRHAAELKVLDDDLIDKIKKYNYHKSAELMKKFGLSQDELEDRMKDENVSAKELKEILKNEYKSLTKEKKKEVLHDLKDNKEKAILKKTIMYGNRLGLDQEEMDEILNDESLTWEEKEAKLRILSKEKMNNGKSDEDEKGSSGKNDDKYEKEYKSKDKSKNEKRGRN